MSDDIAYFDEEVAALGGDSTTLHCDECHNPFEVRDDIAHEMLMWAREGDPIVCPVCLYDEECSETRLKVIHIDKNGKHHRCPHCECIILGMTHDHILCFPASELSTIDEHNLPANFDPVSLPLKYCPDCHKDVAIEEAEALLGDL